MYERQQAWRTIDIEKMKVPAVLVIFTSIRDLKNAGPILFMLCQAVPERLAISLTTI